MIKKAHEHAWWSQHKNRHPTLALERYLSSIRDLRRAGRSSPANARGCSLPAFPIRHGEIGLSITVRQKKSLCWTGKFERRSSTRALGDEFLWCTSSVKRLSRDLDKLAALRFDSFADESTQSKPLMLESTRGFITKSTVMGCLRGSWPLSLSRKNKLCC